MHGTIFPAGALALLAVVVVLVFGVWKLSRIASGG
jgi:Sec-independent protein translocase protein TatA